MLPRRWMPLKTNYMPNLIQPEKYSLQNYVAPAVKHIWLTTQLAVSQKSFTYKQPTML
jgi:hypothetical protein